MLRGMVTECDFEAAECAFPGIVSYYRDLKEKPDTFLELLWGFIHQDCACAEPLPVASRPAITASAR